MTTSREVAAQILVEVDKGAMSNVALNEYLRKENFSSSDRDFIKYLVSGVLETLPELDHIIIDYSGKDASKQKPIVRNVLRLSIYQLLYMPNIPISAVCNEAVKIINKRKMYGLKGFVNALLRRCSENIEELSGKYSEENMPSFIKDIIAKRVGDDKTKIVLEALKNTGKLTCRFNLSKATEDDIIASLNAQNINVTKISFLNNGYILENYDDVLAINAFHDGLIQVQGASSILACETLNPSINSKVLDICAAPGGKSIALADIVGKEGIVYSRDLTESKVKMISNNALRCKMNNIIPEIKDATVFYEEDIEAYDYVMADLPCTGLGTIGHKQEIRYRINNDKINELANLQRLILDNAVRYVKPGGYLLYSTCTITFEENEENAKYIEDKGLIKVNDKQLLPGIDEVSDGFYVSLFHKQ